MNPMVSGDCGSSPQRRGRLHNYKGDLNFMVKLIVGVRGTGKTKMLFDMLNEAVETSKGTVVCVEKGVKIKNGGSYKVRLVDTTEYDICGADALYGLVCGLYASNYDITHVFIDSALKICDKNIEGFARFLELADKISDKNNFQCIITASVAPENLPADITKYTE